MLRNSPRRIVSRLKYLRVFTECMGELYSESVCQVTKSNPHICSSGSMVQTTLGDFQWPRCLHKHISPNTYFVLVILFWSRRGKSRTLGSYLFFQKRLIQTMNLIRTIGSKLEYVIYDSITSSIYHCPLVLPKEKYPCNKL